MGFFMGKGSYLRDGWNLADFLIVLAGIAALLPDIPQFSILRCIRMLRPLRSITRIPGMRMVVSALIDSFPRLISVACVLMMFIFAFAILGMHMFSGLLYNRCRQTPFPSFSSWPIIPNDGYKLCGYRACSSGFCGNPYSYYSIVKIDVNEVKVEELNWGLSNFDDLGQAFLTIFQSITGEGWSTILYFYWNSYNAFLASLFFCAIIIVGNYFMLNLILAAINSSFMEHGRKEDKELGLSLRKKGINGLSPMTPLTPYVTTAKLKEKMRLLEPPRIKNNLFFRICYRIAYNPLFVLFSLVLILANSILLGLNRYPISQDEMDKIEEGLTVFIFYFVAELIIRISAIGIKTFCRDLENLIEAATVVLGLTNFIYVRVAVRENNSLSENTFLKAVRSLMLLRIIKVMNFFKSIKLIIKTVKRTIWKMVDFVIVVVLFIFVAALIGTQLFAYRVRFDQDDNPSTGKDSVSHRVNFDNFGEAFLMSFALVVGDNWFHYMLDTIRAYSETSRVYFLIVVYLGNLTLINVFTAILISNFAEESEKLRKNFRRSLTGKNQSFDYEQFWKVKLRKCKPFFRRLIARNQALLVYIWLVIKKIASKANVQLMKIKTDRFSLMNIFLDVRKIFPLGQKKVSNRMSQNDSVLKRTLSNGVQTYKRVSGILPVKQSIREKTSVKQTSKDARWSILTNFPRIFQNAKARKPSELLYQNDFKNNIYLGIEQSYRNNLIDFDAFNEKVKKVRREKETRKQSLLKEEFNFMSKFKADSMNKLEGVSLNLFKKNNRIRKFCNKVAYNPAFESSLLLLILVSCVFLAASDPLSDPDSSFNHFLFIFDVILAIIFITEVAIKIIVHGLIFNGPNSYLRSGWRFFDFAITLCFILATLQAIEVNLKALKSFRFIRFARIIRALRIIPKNEGLKLTVNSFLRSLPTLFNLILLIFSFFYICSVFLVNNFKGAFHHCSLGSFDKADCFDIGGDWINMDMNMDNVWKAMANLLAISTTDSWADTMFNLVDSVGIDKAPKKDYNLVWKYFCIVFMSMSTFVVLNLFTSLVVDSYQREKDKGMGIASVTHQQREWIKLQMRIFSMSPSHDVKVSKHRFQKKAYKVVENKWFNRFIVSCIILNTFLLCIQPIGISPELKNFIFIMNAIFFAVIIMENFLKFLAFGNSYFTATLWNIFDLFLIALTCVSFYTETHHTLDIYGANMSSLQAFRVFRIFKLFKHYKGLKTVMNTLSSSLIPMAHIGSLIILVLFIYSIIGMNAFSFVRFQSSICPDANFMSFKIAFMTLLRISTGEGWGSLMSDYARLQSPNFVCLDLKNYQDYVNAGGNLGCGTSWSYLFFFSFEVLFKMIVINLFIAVILQSFEDYNHRANFIVNDEDLHLARNNWKMFDTQALGLISMSDYAKFVNLLPPPLGRDLLAESLLQYSINLGIPVYTYKFAKKKEFFFFYYDFFLASSKKAVLNLYEDDILEPLCQVKLFEKFWRRKMRHLIKIRNLVVTEWDVGDFLAIQTMRRFLDKCRNESYKAKKFQFVKEKLKSLTFIEPSALILKKNVSSQKKVCFINEETQEKADSEKKTRVPGNLKKVFTTIIEEKTKQDQEFRFTERAKKAFGSKDDFFHLS